MAKIPKKAAERLNKEIRNFQRVIKKAHDRDVNESDTVTIVTDILSDVFGFDKYSEVTSEQAIRGTYCDLAVKLDGTVQYLIEVKAIGNDLKENHLRQALNYGANAGIPWIVLTNAINWEIHKIVFERPIRSELVCAFNFSDINIRKQEDMDKVFLLCKEGIASSAIEQFHIHLQSVNRYMIGAIITTEPVLNAIRKELRRVSPGIKVTNNEIEKIIVTEVFKRDLIESEPLKDAQKQLKKAARKTQAKSRAKDTEATGDINDSD